MAMLVEVHLPPINKCRVLRKDSLQGIRNMERATQDDYITHRSIHENNHASTFMIIRIKHNPTIFAVDLRTWKELHKMVTSHTGQYTKTIMHQPS